MYVVDVIPLSRTAPGMLSYRSPKNLPVGTLVHITVRSTKTQGIVISSVPVAEAKSMLKRAHFLLSKSAMAAAGKLPDELMRAAEITAKYHATSIGAVLAALFDEYVRAGVPIPDAPLHAGAGFSKECIEFPLAERARVYAARIREHANQGRATLLVSPTLPELQYWKHTLKEFSPVVLSSALAGAKRAEAIAKAQAATGLLISTPSFSWTPVQNLGAIIIDRISAGTYTLPKRPYLSLPFALQTLAEERALPFILGDLPVPLEYMPEHEGLDALSLPDMELLDVRKPKDAEDAPQWQALPEVIREHVRVELSQSGRALLLAARKGYAPAVVCRDCGQAQTDERGMPLSFTTSGGVRRFVTSDGQSEVKASRPCPRCGSWNLLPLGIGIERVEEEARLAFPEAAIVVLTPEIARAPAKAKAALEQFQQPGSVLIATEAVFPWLAAQKNSTPISLGVIVSADSLLALPFWRARERFVRLSYLLRSVCERTVLLTRHPEDAAVDAAVQPSSVRFWNQERQLRTALRYPPFGTLITLTTEGSPHALETLTTLLQNGLSAYPHSLIPDRTITTNTVRRTWVLTLPSDSWPDSNLSEYLASLPPSVRVRIDPESIW